MEKRDNGKKELIIDMSGLFDNFDNTPLTIEEIDNINGDRKKDLVVDFSAVFDNAENINKEKISIKDIDRLLGAVPIEEDEKNGGLKDSYKAK